MGMATRVPFVVCIATTSPNYCHKYYAMAPVGILKDPYKIPIPGTHYVRLSRRDLGIPGFIMIDKKNVAEFEPVGDF